MDGYGVTNAAKDQALDTAPSGRSYDHEISRPSFSFVDDH
jgi:hypothetical protein